MKHKISCEIHVRNLSYFKGDFEKLPPNQNYELVIDYPVSEHASFKIKTGKSGMGFLQLLTEIGKAYGEVYKDANETNSYGVWGHDIGDLALEGIDIDYDKKKITLNVGS